MKICTITCHDVYNAGASLQAYALQTYLNTLPNIENVIIDYKPDYLSRHYYIWGINKRYSKNFLTKAVYYAVKLPKRMLRLLERRKMAYDKFKKKHLVITDKKYTSNLELKQYLPEADIYIAGSDQIWNPLLKNGHDNAFYLDFVPENKKKIAYAASFSVDSLDKSIKEGIKGYLEKFHRISIRESSGTKIVQDLGIQRVIHVVDPVFLLDKNMWSRVIAKNYFEKYILVYDFDNNPMIKDMAQKLSKLYNLKIYSILKSDYADRNFYKCGPCDFVSLIRNAQFVVSNSFHATAFSVIFHTPFYVFNRQWGINSRMRDLVEMCGIEQCMVERLPEEIIDIDWLNVDERLTVMIQKSKDFLVEAIGE